jgi:hypothetical protein
MHQTTNAHRPPTTSNHAMVIATSARKLVAVISIVDLVSTYATAT